MIRVLKNNLLLLGVLFCCNLHAQFKHTAILAPVTKTGFYAIDVTPELSSYIKTDFSDLRIKDDSGKPVAYIIREVVKRYFDTTFTKLRIVSNQLADSGKNILVIEGFSARKMVDAISLIVKNNFVSRLVDVSGSNDGRSWYSIVENAMLEHKFSSDADRYTEVITLPYSSYKYYKLVIYNGNKDPLDVIAAGNYIGTLFNYISPYTSNPESSISQVDSSDGYSYISVHDSSRVHKMFIDASLLAPRFYKRNAELLINNRTLSRFTITEHTGLSTDVPIFNTQDWLIKIDNGDNPPLTVKDLGTSQRKNKILAWLDSGKVYHLEMNDENAASPVYDLQYFKDSIPQVVDTLVYLKIAPIADVATPKPETSFFTKAWLWPVMIVVLLVLVIFTWRLTKEMGKSNQ